jgi:hypothetical protein
MIGLEDMGKRCGIVGGSFKGRDTVVIVVDTNDNGITVLKLCHR